MTPLPTTAGSPEVLVRLLDPDLPPPAYAQPGDAGADLVSAVDIELAPGARAVVPTGVAIALPEGFAAFVHPRSGLAARCGVGLVNAPGTIDSGYRGEIKLIVINHDRQDSVQLSRGDRIAQLVIQRVEHARFQIVDDLPTSARGTGGHGSTGGHPLLTGLSGSGAGVPRTGSGAGVPRTGSGAGVPRTGSGAGVPRKDGQ